MTQGMTYIRIHKIISFHWFSETFTEIIRQRILDLDVSSRHPYIPLKALAHIQVNPDKCMFYRMKSKWFTTKNANVNWE